MGVQTVMYLATYFASDELKMESSQLIITVLIIQIVAILGATLFSKLSDKTNNIFTLCTLICIWILICYFASIVTTISQFYMIAFCVGMVMGGIQSMSRSTYSKLLPDTNFIVTKLGSGLGGYSTSEIKKLFVNFAPKILVLSVSNNI